eukprot:2860767-Alexandrium_andersonii.AAC.1
MHGSNPRMSLGAKRTSGRESDPPDSSSLGDWHLLCGRGLSGHTRGRTALQATANSFEQM